MTNVDAMTNEEIYNGGRVTFINLMVFQASVSVGAFGYGAWILTENWVAGLTTGSVVVVVLLFCIGLLFLILLKNSFGMLRSGTQHVVGEVTLHVDRGEASTWYRMDVAGHGFGIGSEIYEKLDDGDRITVNYYGNGWVKSVYLNERAATPSDTSLQLSI